MWSRVSIDVHPARSSMQAGQSADDGSAANSQYSRLLKRCMLTPPAPEWSIAGEVRHGRGGLPGGGRNIERRAVRLLDPHKAGAVALLTQAADADLVPDGDLDISKLGHHRTSNGVGWAPASTARSVGRHVAVGATEDAGGTG